MFRKIERLVFICLIFSSSASATDNPDELYRQGRFAEAEKAYASSDMDHPKDVRYRYNRGCAAYQNSDYKGAMAAFSSVLKRTKDNDTRFKASYNLGNTAYMQGDYKSAVKYFKQAVLNNPTSEDARYNLEIALRELEKSKKKKAEEKPDKQVQDGPVQPKDNGDQSTADKKGKEQDKAHSENGSQREPSQDKDEVSKGGPQPDRKGESKNPGDASPDEGQRTRHEVSGDLSGELKPLKDLPGKVKVGEGKEQVAPKEMINRKKAEALLDNIKENPSRFLRFQVPDEKRHEVLSGKDW